MSNEKNGYHCQCGKSFDFKSSYDIHVRMSKHDFQDKQKNPGNNVQENSQKIIRDFAISSSPEVLTPPPSPPNPMVIENDEIFRENENFTKNCEKNQEDEFETIDLDDDIVMENNGGGDFHEKFDDHPLSPTTSGSGEDIEIIEQIESLSNSSEMNKKIEDPLSHPTLNTTSGFGEDIEITNEVVNNDAGDKLEMDIFDDDEFENEKENRANVEIQQSKNPMQHDATTKRLPKNVEKSSSSNNSERPKITLAAAAVVSSKTVEILDLEKNENISNLKVKKSDSIDDDTIILSNNSSSSVISNENRKATFAENSREIDFTKNKTIPSTNEVPATSINVSKGQISKKATTSAYKENQNYVRKRKKIDFGLDDLKDGSDHIQRGSDSEEENEFTKIDISKIIAKSPRPKRNCNRNKKDFSEEVIIDLIDDDDDDDFTEKSSSITSGSGGKKKIKKTNEEQSDNVLVEENNLEQNEEINFIEAEEKDAGKNTNKNVEKDKTPKTILSKPSGNENKFPCMYKSCERKGKKFI